MNLIYWLSQRFAVGRGARASTATGAVIAVAGVALAVVVMELSLGIAVGFKQAVRDKVAGFDAPVSVLPPYDAMRGSQAAEMPLNPELTAILAEAVPEGRPVTILSRRAILKTPDNFAAVECLARGSGHDDAFERGNLVAGSWPDFNDESSADSLVISEQTARSLSLGVGDKVHVYFFVDDAVKTRRLFIAGLYRSNFADYDRSIVYVSMGMLGRLSALGADRPTAGALTLEGISVDDAPAAAARAEAVLLAAYRDGRLGELYPVTDITRRGAMYFAWLDLLDTNVVVIFILMLAVAAFTLISSLFIIILDRVATIGVLRSLGMSQRRVGHVFVLVAMKLVGLGMVIGNVVGVGLMLLQQSTRVIPLDPEMYYLDYVPVSVDFAAIALLNAGVALGAWLILILPARIASRIDPATTMRYQ